MRKTPEKRYRERVSKLRNGCWAWTGTTDGTGQPEFMVNGVRMKVRRWAWPSDPVPEYIGTTCGDDRCVRRDHLIAVRAGPRPRAPEAPDEIVQFLIDNPRSHRVAYERFGLTEHELIEVYLEWAATQPAGAPSGTAPRHRPRGEEAAESGLAREILQLLESTEEPF